MWILLPPSCYTKCNTFDCSSIANAASTFIAVFLLMLQCIRRFYETHFVQVFSSTSKMNLSHYIVGYFHYFGALLAIISQAQGFVRGSLPESIKSADITLWYYAAIALFLYAWYNQFISNLILASLRKNNSGNDDRLFASPTVKFWPHKFNIWNSVRRLCSLTRRFIGQQVRSSHKNTCCQRVATLNRSRHRICTSKSSFTSHCT